MIRRLYEKMVTLHRTFVVLILTNAAIGAADMVVGVLFLTGTLDIIATISPHFADEIRSTGAFYFLSHGIIKLLLSWNLLHKKLWAYPVAIVFFGLFSGGQIIELIHGFSWFVLILCAVNSTVFVMVIREYRQIRKILVTQ